MTSEGPTRSIAGSRIGRRLFLTELLLMTAGCHSMAPLPRLPFVNKDEEAHHALLTVEGSVTEIRTTSDWRFMAVLYQKNRRETDEENWGNVSQNGGLKLYNMEFQSPIPFPEAELERIYNPFAVAFGQRGDSCFIAYGSRFHNLDPTASSFPLSVEKVSLTGKNGEVIQIVSEREKWNDVVLSPRGDWLGTQNEEGGWELIDLTDPKKRVVFPDACETEDGKKEIDVSRVLTFSPDGELVAVLLAPSEAERVSRNQTIAIWDLSTARKIPLNKAKRLPLEALYVSEFAIRDSMAGRIAVFSPDGRMIAVRNKRNYVGIWQTAGGRMLSEFGEHRQPVTALKFSPSNTKLAVGTGEATGRIVLWDVRKGTILRTYDDPEKKGKKVTAVEFSPDGNLVYFGNDRGSVKQWEYQAQKTQKTEGEKKD